MGTESDDFIARAKAEAAQLEEKLKEIDNQRVHVDEKLKRLNSFLDVAERPSVSQDISRPSVSSTHSQAVNDSAKIPVKTLVIEAATRLLQEGHKLKTDALLTKLQAEGVQVGGKDKLTAVSAILSREKDRFAASRKDGWSLKEEDKGE